MSERMKIDFKETFRWIKRFNAAYEASLKEGAGAARDFLTHMVSYDPETETYDPMDPAHFPERGSSDRAIHATLDRLLKAGDVPTERRPAEVEKYANRAKNFRPIARSFARIEEELAGIYQSVDKQDEHSDKQIKEKMVLLGTGLAGLKQAQNGSPAYEPPSAGKKDFESHLTACHTETIDTLIETIRKDGEQILKKAEYLNLELSQKDLEYLRKKMERAVRNIRDEAQALSLMTASVTPEGAELRALTMTGALYGSSYMETLERSVHPSEGIVFLLPHMCRADTASLYRSEQALYAKACERDSQQRPKANRPVPIQTVGASSRPPEASV